MTAREPVTKLHSRFSSNGATPTPWTAASEILDQSEILWISTVRPDGRPHVTPQLVVWTNDRLYFCTGPDERKARNLAANPNCILTTGCNALNEGLDLVVEGEAEQVSDQDTLQRLAKRWDTKYGWHFHVRDGMFHGEGGVAIVFAVKPTVVFGFGRDEAFSQTSWRFA